MVTSNSVEREMETPLAHLGQSLIKFREFDLYDTVCSSWPRFVFPLFDNLLAREQGNVLPEDIPIKEDVVSTLYTHVQVFNI